MMGQSFGSCGVEMVTLEGKKLGCLYGNPKEKDQKLRSE